MHLIIDMQNEGFFHAAFNAATISLLPTDTRVYLRPGHTEYLLAALRPDQHACLLSRIVEVPRKKFLPIFIGDAWDTVIPLIKHADSNRPAVVLSAGSSLLAVLLSAKFLLGDIILFAHSLDSIVRKSSRAASIVRFAAKLGSLFSSRRSKFSLVFQRELEVTPPIVQLIRNAGFPIAEWYMPHPIVSASGNSSSKISGRRKIIYLGPPRKEKRPELYIRLAEKFELAHYEFCHVNSEPLAWRSEKIKSVIPGKLLHASISSRDIVFCAYDDSHYELTESGTFLDAVSVRAWVLLTERRALQLKKYYPRLFVFLPCESYWLVKPKSGCRVAIDQLCRSKLIALMS